jgi:DNA repair exonuclease SbcCD nuclease subunit
LNPASVYRSSTFIERKPAHVHVIENPAPIKISEKVEIIGAPWISKRPVTNPIKEALSTLHPAEGKTLICMAHGSVDLLTPDRDAMGLIQVATLERAIEEAKVHFVALGDRHSLTKVGNGDRIWYSGTPESTDFNEIQSGYAQIVEIGTRGVSTRAIPVGQWRFIERDRCDINSANDVEGLQKWFDGIERKERTVLRLKLVGSISLSLRSALSEHLVAAGDVFGAIDVRDDELLALPDDTDFADFGFSGFGDSTVSALKARIDEGGQEGAMARDALMLLLRLARESV